MFEPTTHHSQILALKWCGPSSVREEEEKSRFLIRKVLYIFSQLAARDDLKPCDEVNELYSSLVSICTQPVSEEFSKAIQEDPEIIRILHRLREICSEIEFHAESHWSVKAAGTDESTEQGQNYDSIILTEVYERIQNIPNLDVNSSLVNTELTAMRKVEQKQIKKIAIIGSGPLPLTGLGLIGIFSEEPTNIQTMNIDRDSDAIEVSKKLCKRLGSKAKGMDFLCAQAGSDLDLAEYDAVYLAILVGSTQQEKEILLKNVASKMRPGAMLIIRGATKLRSLMYSVFDPTTDSVSEILDVELVVYPRDHYIVDSVIIGRVK
ncbi:Nicotianamine synthase [Golovinomyces cichoracearum]|uniref:Nicotianamine synthase n=1 Tax=Golovinomyces cichoracearum TaxID=62708 RepID=A0A420J8K1_9PEZI|nr:Nicotianamine synthase [Golovinomyces cichoracearum]